MSTGQPNEVSNVATVSSRGPTRLISHDSCTYDIAESRNGWTISRTIENTKTYTEDEWETIPANDETLKAYLSLFDEFLSASVYRPDGRAKRAALAPELSAVKLQIAEERFTDCKEGVEKRAAAEAARATAGQQPPEPVQGGTSEGAEDMTA